MNHTIAILNKCIFMALCASILCCFLIARDYEEQKVDNASKLASAIADARQAERSAAASRSVQKAILDDEIRTLMPTLPPIALQEIKAKAVMRQVR